MRPSVDFPQPDSPTSPSVSPSRTAKRDVVDGVDRADLALEQALPDREVLLDVLDLEQRRRRSLRSLMRRLRPRRRSSLARRALLAPTSASSGRDGPASLDAVLERRLLACTSRTRAGSAAGTCSPRGALISDGGMPLIECSRSCLGRSSRGIEPSRPQVYGCCGS